MVKSAPLYTAFTVRKAQGEGKDVWIAIGAAWPHRDEKGIDIVLDALPVDGKIVLRLHEPRYSEPRYEQQPREERASYAKKAPRPGSRSAGQSQRWKK